MPSFRLSLFLLALPIFGYAQQFPVNNQKVVQGVGTTAQGITSYSSLPPTTNPSATTWRHVTSMHVDTVERVQYIYKRPRWYAVSFLVQSNPPPATEASGSTTVDYTETIWQNTTDSTSYYYEEKNQCWQPVGTVVRDTTPVSTAATGTSAAVCYEYSLWYNSTNDSLYAYTAGDWLAIGSGGGGTAGAVDSIVVLQDSIVVGYSEGMEVTRDTIGYPAGIALPLAISDVTGLADSLASHPSGTGTNLRIPVWTGTNSLGNSTLLQSVTGQTLDANLAFRITGGTTASRPTGAAGMWYYNTSNNWFDLHNGTSWFNPLRSATATGLGTATKFAYFDANGLAESTTNAAWDNTNSRAVFGSTTPQTNGTLTLSGSNLVLTGATVTGLVLATSDGADNQYTFVSGGGGTNNSETRGGNFTVYGNEVSNFEGAMVFQAGLVSATSTRSGSIWFNTQNAYQGLFARTTGNFGVGTGIFSAVTMPETKAHFVENNSVTAARSPVLTVDARSTGTPATGFGPSLQFRGEEANGDLNFLADVAALYTSHTSGSEVADFVVRTLRTGTLTESLRSLGNGTLQIGTLSGTATQMVGATAANILCPITLGAGLSFSSGTLNGAFLPLTLTGATEVNTAGQSLYFRDAAGYPFTFMNSTYFLAASGVNNYVDVGSTTSNVKVISDGLIELNSSVNTSIITTGRFLIDGDSTVVSGTLPVNTNATHVLVRDAVTERLEEKAIGSVGTWLKPELEAGNDVTIVSPGGNEVDISGIDFFYLSPDQSIELSAGTSILFQAVNNVQALCDTFEVQGIAKITDITNGDATSIAGFNSGNVATTVTPGAGINVTSGEIRTTQSFFNSYDDVINLTGVTTTADTIRPASNVKSNDWSYSPTTYTHTYTGTASRYFSISVSAQVESPNCCHKGYIEVYKNGTVTSAQAQGYLTDATAAVTLHGQSIVLLSTGDTINAKFYGSEISGEDYDLLNFSLIVIQL